MIQLNLSPEEARLIVQSLKNTHQHMKTDSRHARDARTVQSLFIRLEAELSITTEGLDFCR